jgi:hypothetical protein
MSSRVIPERGPARFQFDPSVPGIAQIRLPAGPSTNRPARHQ